MLFRYRLRLSKIPLSVAPLLMSYLPERSSRFVEN
jgi:hypothetical protein